MPTDLDKAPSELLVAIKKLLEDKERPAIDRLATVACLVLVSVIDSELQDRATPKKGKG